MSNHATHPSIDSPPSRSPSFWANLFASQFTSTWMLGALLAVCFVLPCYDGCNNSTIYGYSGIAEAEVAKLTVQECYLIFLGAWPFLLGLLVAVGTIVGLARHSFRLLWWLLAILTLGHGLFHGLLLFAAYTELRRSMLEEKLENNWPGYALSGVTLLTLLMPWLTRRYCKSLTSAAMWQLAMLALLGAISVSFVIPMIYLAGDPLIGGKLAHMSCLGLLVMAIVHIADGHRALERTTCDSPLKLSLRATLILMLVGGVLFAWGMTYAFVNLVPKE